MKRFKTYIKVRFNGQRDVIEVYAEKYDEHTYFVNGKWKENKGRNLYKPYELIDINTGIMVVGGNTKQEMIDKYSQVTNQYFDIRFTRNYLKWTEEYTALCERAKNNKVDDCEVER